MAGYAPKEHAKAGLTNRIAYAIVEAKVAILAGKRVMDCEYEYHFVLDQMRALQAPFGLAVRVVLVVFNYLLFWQPPFHRRPLQKRSAIIERLERKRYPLVYGLMQFFCTLTLFAYFSRPMDR